MGPDFHSLILTQVSDAVVVIDADGRVTYLNQSAEKLYQTTAADAIGRPLTDIYQFRWLRPEDAAAAARALDADGSWRGENLHVRRDGSTLIVESAVTQLRDHARTPIGLLAVIRDVTEARAREAALREREERLRRAIDIETVGVLFFTLDGRILDANAAFQRMSGYTLAELQSSAHWQALTAGEFMPVTLRAARELLERGETAPYEKQMIRKDGSRWWGLFAPRRLGGAAPDAECVEFIVDMTAAKEADAALKGLEARQRMALDAAELGTWDHDLAASAVTLDERARQHYDLDRSRVPIDAVVARIHPDDRPDLQQAIARAIDPAQRAPVKAEYRVILRDGRTRWLAVNGHVQFERGADGERAVAGIGTTRDITAAKEAEAVVRDAARRKDEFLAILAHELRNPLAPIRTAVGILRSADAPEPLLERSRDIIDRQVAQMARLIDDLLDVSRLSSGKMHLQRSPILLDEVLDAAIETARPTIEEHGHRLNERRAAAPIRIEGDHARLAQVFANLLNNAAKYTPAGGTIDVEVTSGAGRVAVRIADTGQGISPDYLDKIFELFAQGAGGDAPTVGGLGIGLALARRLVDLHGGTLTAASEGPGRGAAFTVELPIVPQPAATDARANVGATARPRVQRRVLVVDDNTDAAETTAMLLQAYGCDVRVAFSGERAIAQAAEFAPEVVLLDIGMPGMNGLETCTRLRARPASSSMFIVALTGWGSEENRRQTQQAGFDAHLVKPVAPDELLKLIEGVKA